MIGCGGRDVGGGEGSREVMVYIWSLVVRHDILVMQKVSK